MRQFPGTVRRGRRKAGHWAGTPSQHLTRSFAPIVAQARRSTGAAHHQTDRRSFLSQSEPAGIYTGGRPERCRPENGRFQAYLSPQMTGVGRSPHRRTGWLRASPTMCGENRLDRAASDKTPTPNHGPLVRADDRVRPLSLEHQVSVTGCTTLYGGRNIPLLAEALNRIRSICGVFSVQDSALRGSRDGSHGTQVQSPGGSVGPLG